MAGEWLKGRGGSAANDPGFRQVVEEQVRAIRNKVPYHSLDLGNGRIINGVIPVEYLKRRLSHYPIGADLRGKRVLDIGCASGWNSFELERRGAEVVALDCVEYPEFLWVKRQTNSKVEYVILDVDEMNKERLGEFDITIFFGVLYHLRHPLLALEQLCSMTREFACVESHVIDGPVGEENNSGNILEFYETDELGGQIDNWFGPTRRCLSALCRSAGFARTTPLYLEDRRAGLVAHRHGVFSSAASYRNPNLILCFAVNNRHQDQYFTVGKDEYICISILWEQGVADRTFEVEIDGYGVPVLVSSQLATNRLQVNVRVPPGLDCGSHTVRIVGSDSGFSNTLSFDVLTRNDRRVTSEKSETSSSPRELHLVTPPQEPSFEPGSIGDIFFRTSGWEPRLADLSVEMNGAPVHLLALGYADREIRQLKFRIPREAVPGSYATRMLVPGMKPTDPMIVTVTE